MKIIFGLKESEGGNNSPKWYRDLSVKYQDEKDKTQELVTTIKKYYIFDDSEATLYPTLLMKIVNRDWTVSDIGNRAALVNAERSLSPF